MKTQHWILIGVVTALMMFGVGRCSTRAERRQLFHNVQALNDTVHHYQITLQSLQYEVSQQSAVILTQRQALEAGLLEREQLKALHMKAVNTNVSLQAEIHVLRDSLKALPQTIFITVKDTTGIAAHYVKIPFTLLNVQESYLQLSAGMTVNRNAWFDLTIPVSKFDVTVGWQRDGWFRLKPVGTVVTDNPYITVKQMEVTVIDRPKKWYDRKWLYVVGGVMIDEGVRRVFKH